jgi:hypothetical protein
MFELVGQSRGELGAGDMGASKPVSTDVLTLVHHDS